MICRICVKSTPPPSPTAGKYRSSELSPTVSLTWIVVDQVLDLFELVAKVDPLVVVEYVRGIEVEPHLGMVDIAHQGEHGGGVLGGPLVGFERDRDPVRTGGVADLAEVGDDRPALVGIGRLPCPRDDGRDAEPARGEPDPPLDQAPDALAGAEVGPADDAAS